MSEQLGKSPAAHMLGKHPAKHDRRTLQLGKYLAHDLPDPPAAVDWTAGITDWGMMLNDQIGICGLAAPGHQIESWRAVVGSPTVVPDADILAAYEAVAGYDPNDPSTDTGSCELDVLNYWRKTGIGGHFLGAYADVSPKNIKRCKQAINLFGGAYIGLSLPNAVCCGDLLANSWTTVGDGDDWQPNQYNGHAVEAVGYSGAGIQVVTWGALKWMSLEFFDRFCDEFHALLSNDILDGTEKSPLGLDLAALNVDLSEGMR